MMVAVLVTVLVGRDRQEQPWETRLEAMFFKPVGLGAARLARGVTVVVLRTVWVTWMVLVFVWSGSTTVL